jgi:hypothetical protein
MNIKTYLFDFTFIDLLLVVVFVYNYTIIRHEGIYY